MTHPDEEALVSYALGGAAPGTDPALGAHLRECEECRAALDELRRVLDAMTAVEVPARGPEYGAEVWARIEPRLPARQRRRIPPWFAAAAAVLIAVSAFVIGRWSGAPPASSDRQSAAAAADERRSIRERVVLAALGDHFDRAERTLVELANTGAAAKTVDITAEQAWARDLLAANRLYRQSAQEAASPALAALLDEIEPVLLEIVNSPARLTAGEFRALQARIEDRSLVFKLRVTGARVRAQQRTLVQTGEPTS